MIAWLTARIAPVAAFVMAILAGLVWHKRVVQQRDHWKDKAQSEKARADFQTDVAEAEAKIEQAHEARKKAADKEVSDGQVPEHLRNPRKH